MFLSSLHEIQLVFVRILVRHPLLDIRVQIIHDLPHQICTIEQVERHLNFLFVEHLVKVFLNSAKFLAPLLLKNAIDRVGLGLSKRVLLLKLHLI